MKIGRETIPGLTQRNTAGGLRYYWEPSPAQRRAGWKTTTLPADLSAAVAAAKRRNIELDDWKSGGAKPRQVARYVKAQTFGALVKRYRTEKLALLAKNTQRVDGTALTRLEAWAGDQPVTWITRARVKALRDGLMSGATRDGAGHAVAFHTLTVLRRVFAWGIDEGQAGDNPAERFNLPAPKPRDQVWEDEDLAAFATAAIAEQQPSMALAVELGAWCGQREDDILHLSSRRWKESPPLDRAEHDRLAGPDGTVKGFEVIQKKTKRPLFLYFSQATRAKIEAAFAVNAQRKPAVGTVLVCDDTGRPWTQRNFIRVFNQVRERAVKDGHARLADLQYRDLRRTCIVRLGRLGLNDAQISAISGHKLETTKRILEVYLPRDYRMGAGAVIARIGDATIRDATRTEKSA